MLEPMMPNAIDRKFAALATEHAPGQEIRLSGSNDDVFHGDRIEGCPVDFSHGDVDAFTPIPGAVDAFVAGFEQGGSQAYTEYLGDAAVRRTVIERLGAFTGVPSSEREDLIITPGTQGALFLAMGAMVARGTKVAIVEPDYFANRKLVRFFEGELLNVPMNYLTASAGSGIDLDRLESVFKAGAEVFVFSNPNNPTGVVYSEQEIDVIASLASRHGVKVIVDQLYSRLLYSGQSYHHLRKAEIAHDNLVTIIGPSKTESMSGFRLGAAWGGADLIGRMAKLQAIVSLRAAGYCQAVLRTWMAEPSGWMAERIVQHQAIRDDLLAVLRKTSGVTVRTPQAGSYIFPSLPELRLQPLDFVRALRVQAGVTVTPGTEFSLHTSNSIRFNYSQDHEAAVDAMKRTVKLIDRYRL